MTEQEIKRVKQYLYSISRLELSAANLRHSIEDIEGQLQGSIIKSTVYDKIVVTGGESSSKPESAAENDERLTERLLDLRSYLGRQERKLSQFDNAMELLSREGHLGHLAANIVRHKYIQRIAPDYTIYAKRLYCSRITFYRAHRIGIRFFYEVIPECKMILS